MGTGVLFLRDGANPRLQKSAKGVCGVAVAAVCLTASIIEILVDEIDHMKPLPRPAG
jgi:hypothetical protein